MQTGQHKRAGLVVVTIELEKALSQTMSNMQPTKTWSPYRDPLAKFLNRYAPMVDPPPPGAQFRTTPHLPMCCRDFEELEKHVMNR